LKQADRAVDEGLIEEDENENEEGDLEEPTSAYTTLLQTLQATSGSFSRAISQRYLLETIRSKLRAADKLGRFSWNTEISAGFMILCFVTYY
jgi:hypothetical protein